jgi:ABC-type lipoprotein export system ATPase subunit
VPVASVMRNEPYLTPKVLAKQLAENAQVSSLRNRLLQIERLHKLTELQTQLQFIMGFDVFELRVAFDPNEDLYITAEFRTDKKDPYQDIAMLGSGTLQMLEVLVSLNLAAKSSCRVVLLDEPDSFLHRALQQNLIAKLREISTNGVQIISTTHNEQIISSANLTELYHLGNPKQGQKVQSLSADLPHGRTTGFISPVSKSSLYDALGVSASAMNILEAIEADKLVLVEGRTDALYLQALQAKRQQLMPTAQPQKVAYWSINGMAQLGYKLKYWQDILSNIKNAKSLWEKAQLLIDRDLLDEAEMQEVISKIEHHFRIKTHNLPSYTLESTFLLDQAKFKKLLAKLFQLPPETLEQAFANWAEAISVESRLARIQGQRKDRIKDFEPLESNLLKNLCDGNQYSQYIDQLKADPQQLARLTDKDDLISLLTTLDEIASQQTLTALTNEAMMLKLIDQLDTHTWPTEWTGILKQIYG